MWSFIKLEGCSRRPNQFVVVVVVVVILTRSLTRLQHVEHHTFNRSCTLSARQVQKGILSPTDLCVLYQDPNEQSYACVDMLIMNFASCNQRTIRITNT